MSDKNRSTQSQESDVENINSKVRPDSPSAGNDAVCFTAGFSGATFGAGTIHAYLAADREAPAVVAGISMGAVNAAAFQRSYQELVDARTENDSKVEVSRFRWFRRYLLYMIDKPFNVIWDALPNQSDFFADMIPVKDPTVDENKTEEEKAPKCDWIREELMARRELYLFVKLGHWLASLPVTISRVANLLVTYVRKKEKYPDWRRIRPIKYWYLWLRLLFTVIRHICLAPCWFPEKKFRTNWRSGLPLRPLFGWLIYSASWFAFVLFLLVVAALTWAFLSLFLELDVPFSARVLKYLWPICIYFLAIDWFIFVLAYRKAKRKRVVRSSRNFLFENLLSNLELQKSLVYDFHLRKKLIQLFLKDGGSPSLGEQPMPIVLVAAPLQQMSNQNRSFSGGQVWAHPPIPLVDALCAAIAQPGLFRPLHLDSNDSEDKKIIKKWLPNWQGDPAKLDLVDGNVVRQNPIPSLFSFLKDERQDLLKSLESDRNHPTIHVVYNVPLQGQKGDKKYGPLGMNIVDVVRLSMQLNKRRDTLLEVQQTNFISRLEEEVRHVGANSKNVNALFADEIAPEEEITFKNYLDPQPEEILSQVANGCRRTLEALYKNELKEFPVFLEKVYCPTLLAKVAKKRRWSGYPGGIPGLPEVCSNCTKWLARPRERKKSALNPNLAGDFPMLTGKKNGSLSSHHAWSPRIVFLGCGGVFRGPFHAGMLACLLSAQIRPQMIIGASVGTLMGGALGALLSAVNYKDAVHHLGEIVDTLLKVDHRIAFTKILKGAAREIGIRARSIHLSPNNIRRIIRAGGRSDPGFAATGAPSFLIDALADLLMIPHQRTSKIVAEFVAGHVSKATKMLLEQMKSETLRRLDLEHAVIGTSLLESTAWKLLGGRLGIDLNKAQPFKNIAFFGTTTDLISEEPKLLGEYNVEGGAGTYNFVEAALASGAFPGVFAPRRESEIFPGAGRIDVLLSDGGMFDNLPFIRAISILSKVQRVYSRDCNLDSAEFLEERHRNPDLFIAGSLNVRPDNKDSQGPYDDLVTIAKRAKSLQNDVKIQSFQHATELIGRQLDKLIEGAEKGMDFSDKNFIDGIVDATVLPVFPVDRDHLNPTFAFCASTGLKPERVQKSIGDGCFQTFAALADTQDLYKKQFLQASRSVDRLVELKQFPEIVRTRPPNVKALTNGRCPFFQHSTDTSNSQKQKELVLRTNVSNFTCPFFKAGPTGPAIYETCVRDPVHG